jgi:hypothetical protein
LTGTNCPFTDPAGVMTERPVLNFKSMIAVVSTAHRATQKRGAEPLRESCTPEEIISAEAVSAESYPDLDD